MQHLYACAAVFDGHSGFAAAQYLSEHLYDCFSDAIDEGSYGPECSVDGVTLEHLSSPHTQQHYHSLHMPGMVRKAA